jgi:hypothetical protein
LLLFFHCQLRYRMSWTFSREVCAPIQRKALMAPQLK